MESFNKLSVHLFFEKLRQASVEVVDSARKFMLLNVVNSFFGSLFAISTLISINLVIFEFYNVGIRSKLFLPLLLTNVGVSLISCLTLVYQLRVKRITKKLNIEDMGKSFEEKYYSVKNIILEVLDFSRGLRPQEQPQENKHTKLNQAICLLSESIEELRQNEEQRFNTYLKDYLEDDRKTRVH